jgi:hypothetical protein
LKRRWPMRDVEMLIVARLSTDICELELKSAKHIMQNCSTP